RLAEELQSPRPDFAMLSVFGDFAEDGALQDMLDVLAIPYVGSPADAVRTCADKVVTKHVLAGAGLPTLSGRVLARRTLLEWGRGAAVVQLLADIGGPVVVKPVRGSGGLGVKLVVSAEQLPGVISGALLYDGEALIEPFVAGRELCVIVTGEPGHAQ